MDERMGTQLDVLLLGSSALLLMKGVSKSPAEWFFLHRMRHWQFAEKEKAFGIDLDRWLYFEEYPPGRSADEQQSQAHYVNTLDSAFLLTGLEQYKIGQRPQRGSIE